MQDKVILLVEDNPDDEALTLRALKKSNICNEVVVVRDGEQALRYLLDEGRELPALVLLDLKLPKADGLEVLRRLRADRRAKALSVIILISSKQEGDVISDYDLGPNSYVRKPVDFDQLSEAVRQLGLYWLLLNEPSPVGGKA